MSGSDLAWERLAQLEPGESRKMLIGGQLLMVRRATASQLLKRWLRQRMRFFW